jgi:hypothetical protein
MRAEVMAQASQYFGDTGFRSVQILLSQLSFRESYSLTPTAIRRFPLDLDNTGIYSSYILSDERPLVRLE